MQGDQNQEFRRAAAECLELAQHARDDNARAALLAMAQKWLELASDEFGARRFHELLQELNEQQMLDTKH
jgi:site-specific recombinase